MMAEGRGASRRAAEQAAAEALLAQLEESQPSGRGTRRKRS
jgi:dsRNA-specific ribonuclease